MTSYFERVGAHTFRPTELTGGAWAVDEQHIAPMTGLIVHEIDRMVAARGGSAAAQDGGAPAPGGSAQAGNGSAQAQACDGSAQSQARGGSAAAQGGSAQAHSDSAEAQAHSDSAEARAHSDSAEAQAHSDSAEARAHSDSAEARAHSDSAEARAHSDSAEARAGGGSGRPAGGDGLVVGRISMDILGVLKLAEFEVRTEVVRAGRTIELVEAVVSAGGRPAVRARVWRMNGQDTTAVAGGAPGPLPDPESLARAPLSDVWPGGFITSVDVRYAAGPEPGRAVAWVGTGTALVAGEAVSPLADFVKVVDTANGIAVRESPKEWMFPNLDLTIHLHRQPAGPWTGLDTTVVFGAGGQGVTSTVLHDVHGPVGRAEQILTVRPL
ncbi:thioesterase family protein [Actinoplanes sp. RD1]|uniref:thioesterase family protein n=1 Tax=Actinoplanes sp. RD1 TaxID=3064538 RepID=UPI0027424701|nr:acyl-CoA thioesterase domain-containing protein [Actinoplanes sp. RD1]